MVVFHVFLIVHVIVNRVKHHIWCNLVDIQRVRWLHFIQDPADNHMTCSKLTIETLVNHAKHHIWCNPVDIRRVRWVHFIQDPTDYHMTCAKLGIKTLEQAVDMFKIYNKESKETPMGCVWFYFQVWIYFTPRSVCIVSFGDMNDGWISPWFERRYGRPDS